MRDIDDTLRKYSDLTIRVGLNLQPGQRLAIVGPLANGGVSLDAAPLVRCLTRDRVSRRSQLRRGDLG